MLIIEECRLTIGMTNAVWVTQVFRASFKRSSAVFTSHLWNGRIPTFGNCVCENSEEYVRIDFCIINSNKYICCEENKKIENHLNPQSKKKPWIRYKLLLQLSNFKRLKKQWRTKILQILASSTGNSFEHSLGFYGDAFSFLERKTYLGNIIKDSTCTRLIRQTVQKVLLCKGIGVV